MTDAETLEQANDWLIMKRGLYFRPSGSGYTGIRDQAGRYSEKEARKHENHGNCVIMRAADAPEFTAAAFDDLVIKHLTGQRDTLAKALHQVREEIVMAIAFLGRDVGTDRLAGTIDGLTKRLAAADQAILSALDGMAT